MNIMNYLYFISFIILTIIVIFNFIKLSNTMTKEKFSPFECGFDPFSLTRVSFSLKFFFIAIVFLIFDVEIVIILPFPMLLMNKNLSLMFSFILINFLIMIGFLFEWKSGMLDWIK
uniref:NADH-ubiquinone oxidoreductase chain 3 n=1 Tax=Amblyomma gervaisi TaxID=1987576 RepID=A0A977TPU5_9ACAR|nr:NADH dehydrogenase subunit 3 [Amblyomma gervaisi]UXX50152.1 NADH dehydrogenase subunit 3 [Amblyomma gervaisi]